MVRPLSEGECIRRARRIRLVASDVDGVLTDAGVYYSARGEELVRFSRRDGMGVERLRDAGIATALITRESSPIVAARAQKLQARLHQGIRDKQAHFGALLSESDIGADELAFIGDDVNDLGLIELVAETGLCGAPADAQREVLERVHFVTLTPGGHGAFREFADYILRLREERS